VPLWHGVAVLSFCLDTAGCLQESVFVGHFCDFVFGRCLGMEAWHRGWPKL